jgi:hypothetical protein
MFVRLSSSGDNRYSYSGEKFVTVIVIVHFRIGVKLKSVYLFVLFSKAAVSVMEVREKVFIFANDGQEYYPH